VAGRPREGRRGGKWGAGGRGGPEWATHTAGREREVDRPESWNMWVCVYFSQGHVKVRAHHTINKDSVGREEERGREKELDVPPSELKAPACPLSGAVQRGGGAFPG